MAERGPRRRKRRHSLNQTVTLDGTPLFRGHRLMLLDAAKHGWKGKVNSADRRKGIPEKYGKLSQYALYMGWLAGKAGYAPANRPGRSTHELRSDSVAYRGPVGRPLAWWQLGLDVTESDQLLAILNRLGYDAFRPYSAGSERHHINLRKSPRRNLIKRGKWERPL